MMKILKNCVQYVEIKSLVITMDCLPVKAARSDYCVFDVLNDGMEYIVSRRQVALGKPKFCKEKEISLSLSLL